MLRELETYRRLPVDFVSAEGCELVQADGKRVLDLYGGHCVNTLGAGDTFIGAFCFAMQHCGGPAAANAPVAAALRFANTIAGRKCGVPGFEFDFNPESAADAELLQACTGEET